MRSIRQTLAQLNDREAELEKQLETYTASYEQVAPFTQLNYDISSILHFRCIKFRFGRISLEYFEKFQSFVYDAVDTILFKCREDEEYVWLVYFTPAPCADKVDAIYASMHFERLFLPDDYEGTPKEAAQLLEEKIAGIKADLESIRKERQSVLESRREELTGAAERLNRYTRNFDVRKLAACTNHDDNTFFILCGWMTARDAAAFQKESESDKDLFLILEPDHNDILSKPPTKMRNPGIFRPFEMFIQMYGLPDYNEIDPTILVAITYSVFFRIHVW